MVKKKLAIRESRPIAVCCHWHAGTTILARTLAMCGMEVGNENTFWIPEENEGPCEHGLLNQIGDQICLGNLKDFSLAQSRVEEILLSYNKEAKRLGWYRYGVKITHVLQEECWPVFKNAFQYAWPNAIYVVLVRDPHGIIQSTHNKDWSEKRINDSIESTENAILDIKQNKDHIVLHYPKSWFDGSLQKAIKKLDLKWKKEAQDLFDFTRMKEGDL